MQYICINIQSIHNYKEMNPKAQRFATIRKIIRSELIGSQEELINRLHECGIEITQSTLSRDLKFLNVAKVPHKNKGYIYVLPNAAPHDVNVSANISDKIGICQRNLGSHRQFGEPIHIGYHCRR